MKAIGLVIAALLVASTLTVEAQTPNKIPRVGFLRLTRKAEEPKLGRLEEFRQGLRQLGYIEGQNISLELRWAEDKLVQVPVLMTELVRLNVDVIVTHGPAGVRAAKEATNTIPVVIARMDDADVAGFVASLARPGGNITGLSFQTGEVSGKLLDLLKECRPKISRLAVLYVGEALRHGLREFEYIDGQNAVFAYRYADCNVERLPQLASELVKLRRNVISDPVWAQRSQDGAAGVCRQDPRGRKPADLPVQHLNSSLTARRQNKLV